MRSRKQMTPGIKKCKDKYSGGSSPYKKTESPYKGADATLIKNAGTVAQGEIDAVSQETTGSEKWAKIAQQETSNQMKKYGMDDDEVIDPFYGTLSTDQQTKKNLEA